MKKRSADKRKRYNRTATNGVQRVFLRCTYCLLPLVSLFSPIGGAHADEDGITAAAAAAAPFWTWQTFLLLLGIVLACGITVFCVVSRRSMRRVNRELRQALEEQRTTTQALRENEERYRTLFDRAPQAVAVSSTEEKVLFVNGPFCRMFGYTEEECQNLPVSVLHPESDWPIHQEVFADATLNRPAVLENTDCIRKDGTHFQCDIVVTRVQIDAKDALFAFFSDVTEKRTIIDEIRQSEKLAAVGQLAGGIAHDFNNQLGGILGYADLLLDELEETPSARQMVEGIISAAEHASELTRQMLAFARKGKYEIRTVDLHQLIEELVSLLRHSIDKRITVKTRFHIPEALTQGDPGQLQNALLNLALNARDAMPEGGTLRFETSMKRLSRIDADGEYLCITVSDSGLGMSEDVIAHAFEPFFTTKGTGKGTGMGLAAVYGTVKNHDGAVDIESSEGNGTSVLVYLRPLQKQEEGTESNEDTTLTLRLAQRRVLLVDDEQIIRDVIGQMLRRAGLHVVTASDGLEAVTYFAQHSREIDLVLLDMVMPRMDGRTAYREMKALRPNIKVLLCSGFSMDQAADALRKEGVLGILRKPFRKQELLSAIENALSPGDKT